MGQIEQGDRGRKTCQGIRIAAYMRLSKASGASLGGKGAGQEESNSISMQRMLIEKYIAAHFVDCQITEYQDDGFSGVNFHRPGVQRMLEDVRNQRVDCIIVKDISRFGRDYMEVGSYLEQIFPFLGVRFISINDGYDSGEYQGSILGLEVNFKNLLYDLYSKDLSQKVKASLQVKKERGQYVSAHAPFGYQKLPDDRHRLRICEEEANVVREIFSLALQGATASQIAKKLNMENIPTPLEFRRREGSISRQPKGEKFFWGSGVVWRILHNPVYVGDIAYGKTEKEQVGGRSILKPREEWNIIPDYHAPIIARKDFEEVQQGTRRNSGRRQGRKGLLDGWVVCGYCRHKLQRRDGEEPGFICPNYYMLGEGGCIPRISARRLEQAVVFRVEEYLGQQGAAEELASRYRARLQEKRASLLQEIRRAKREYGGLRRKQYEEYSLFAMGEQEAFCSCYGRMQEKQQVIQGLQEQLGQIDKRVSETEPGKLLAGEWDLAAEVMEQYIEEIVIYDEEKMEIRWKCLPCQAKIKGN